LPEKLLGEGHRAVDWGIGGSVELLLTAGAGPKDVRSQWAAVNCAAPPTTSADQFTKEVNK